jgi:hypothetical protein
MVLYIANLSTVLGTITFAILVVFCIGFCINKEKIKIPPM